MSQDFTRNTQSQLIPEIQSMKSELLTGQAVQSLHIETAEDNVIAKLDEVLVALATINSTLIAFPGPP